MIAIDSILAETGNAWRELRRRPGAAALVVAVLALGLGGMLFVAGMIDGLIVKPLPFAAPERLFHAGLIDNDDPPDTDRFDAARSIELIEWREFAGQFADIAGVQQRTINLSDGERPERYEGASVSANLFAVLGVQPMLGRGFSDADEQPGAEAVVLLSARVWRERYLSDPAILGREIRVNARPARVVGVMPEGFAYPWREQVWIPATLARGVDGDEFDVALRLREGADVTQLRAALDAWYADALRREPERMRSEARGVGLQPLPHYFVDGTTRSFLWTLGVAVALVLAVACANAASLLLARMAARRDELWLRGALGASHGRLALQLFVQTGLLALLALALAFPVAQGLVAALLAALGDEGPPQWMNFDPDARMLAFAAAVALLTAAFTALLPALRAGGPAERGAGGRVHSGRGIAGLIRLLVVGEVALSCALLIGAAVMVQAMARLDRFDLGLDTRRVLTARIGLFEGAYPDAAARNGYVQRLRERLLRDPEVEAVSFSSSLPGLIGNNVDVLEQGLPRPETGLPDAGHSLVDEHFAATMGAQLLRGRWFHSGDFHSGDLAPGEGDGVIVVDETFARRFAPDGEVLGRRFLLEGGGSGTRHAVVVGVLRPVQMDDIDDLIEPAVFEPMRAAPNFFSVLVRTRGKPMRHADGFLRAAAEVDPDTPAYWVRGYDAVLAQAVVGIRVLSRTFSGFGLVALGLALAGLYGVIGMAVAQRTREVGVRRALGAPDAHVLVAMAGRSLWQVALGLVLGLALGLPFARLLAAPIPHVAAVEARIWLAVLTALALAALLAVWLPARRALKVQPMAALREE